MVSVTHNEIINAIVLAENVAYMNAQARAIVLGNGETPCASDNAKAIEIEQWIAILERAEANVTDGCLDDEIIWKLIQNINEQYRGVDCDVSRTFSRNSSSGGGTNVPTGYVERVLGVNVDNSNPSRPVVTIYVDGVTITGDGTEGDPFVAVGGGGSSVWGSITGTLSNQTDLQNALTARELIVNKSTNVVTDQASNTKYPSVKAVFDWATSTFTTAAAVAVQITSALVGYATEAWVTSQNYLVKNANITGATKTKITYDAKGLVTSGADATTADIADSTDRRYVTDAQLVVIGNTSGTNTGDQNLFSKIAVSGQSDVVPDSTTDTLTLVAGTNVTITTDAINDSITISAAGGGSGSSWDATIVTGNLTAANKTQYIVTASATFTDPTPAAGEGFLVFIRNGTATIGGTAYSAAGSIVWRVYHSGAWANYYQSPYNDATSSIQAQLNAVSAGNFWTIECFPQALPTPVDSTTYYFPLGTPYLVPSTAATGMSSRLPYASKIIGAEIRVYTTTAGTSESSSLYLRNATTATSNLIGNFTTNGNIAYTSITGVSITPATTDDIYLEWRTPAWYINPINARVSLTLFLERV